MIQMIDLIIMNHYNQANQKNHSSDKMQSIVRTMIQMIDLIIMNHYNQANQKNHSSDKMLRTNSYRVERFTEQDVIPTVRRVQRSVSTDY